MLYGRQPFGVLGLGILAKHFFQPKFWKHPLIQGSQIHLFMCGPTSH